MLHPRLTAHAVQSLQYSIDTSVAGMGASLDKVMMQVLYNICGNLSVAAVGAKCPDPELRDVARSFAGELIIDLFAVLDVWQSMGVEVVEFV